ncbi:MAG: dTMP kinase [Candidatus Eisenbacteria bacterium RBG_16_71_46]|nr:MAG: dTMP kinase [Candidatus Eisenbacteria bacterium RBG_16_71_46]
MPGLLVTFEGGEGSGKSTQLARLAARCAELGIEPLVTREPGGTPLAEGIRGLLLDPARRPGPVAEAFLMEAARAELVTDVIRPALAGGRVVMCDRFDDSTLAYQGGGRGLDLEQLADWNRAATGGLTPDLTLLYDLDPAVGLARRAQAPGPLNRLDREPPEFHARVRERYVALARAAPGRFVVLDAALPPERLELLGWAALEAQLRRRGLIPSA